MSAMVYLLVLAFIALVPMTNNNVEAAQSHQCTDIYYSYRTTCVYHRWGYYYWWWRPYWYYRYWGWWYYWGWYRRPYCSNTRTTHYRTKCCPNFKGPNCDIPICSPKCQNNGVCVEETSANKCDCPSSHGGATCSLERCNWDKTTDCFPGSCRSGSCFCSPEFEGDNCEKMKEGPVIKSCRGSILHRETGGEYTALETSDCEREGEEEKIYTNKNDISHIGVDFVASTNKLDYFPQYPSYLRFLGHGVVSAWAVVTVKNTGGGIVNNVTHLCDSVATSLDPQQGIKCDMKPLFSQGLTHKQQLEISMFGKSGGFKEAKNSDVQNTYVNKTITGSDEFLKVVFYFDLEAPKHCSETDSCDPENDETQPIIFDREIREDPNVTITFTGWDDTEAGLKEYKYEVYPMRANGEGVLQNDSVPIITGSYDVFDEDRSNATFNLPQPGMYSILGQVFDFAGNNRYTRALLLYHDGSHGIEVTENPFKVTPGPGPDTIDGAFWINDLDSEITISWKGRFVNHFIDDNKYTAEIKPLHHPHLLSASYGNISTSGTPSINGITDFGYSVIERIETGSRRRRELKPPEDDSWIEVLNDSDEMTLDLNMNDGDGFTVWVRAGDMLRNTMDNYIYIRADSTPPITSSEELTFVKNIQGPTDGYFSGINITTSDTDSGIHRINLTLTEDTGSDVIIVNIKEHSQPGQRVDKTKDECDHSSECICTNENECYKLPQTVYINNCWFVEYMGVPAIFNAYIYNRARLSTPVSLHLGDITGLSGIGEFPKPRSFRLKAASGYSVILTWHLPAACYAIRSINLVYTGGNGGQAQYQAGISEAELVGLQPFGEYTAELYIVYENRKESERVELIFDTGEPPNPSGGGPIGTGGVVGIVIGILVLLALGIVAILIVIRIKQKKTPVPRRVMTMKNNIMNRLSRRFHPDNEAPWVDEEAPPPYPGTVGHSNQGMTMNVAYTTGPKLRDFEEDLYTYGELQTDPEAQWKHSNDKVTIGRSIQVGRFAQINEATLRDNQGLKKVAAKMLKNHTTENDLLMKAKMNFMATAVPNHNNIVNFVGAITEGPVLLLEFCDQSLKDWLSKIEKITDEVEDNMINFCTDIARGMQHLHENEIIHRRLGVRNVLLKEIPLMGRKVAKVTGFGPMKGEVSGDNMESEKERIPIKWMAIEQLGIEKGEKRPYDEKTDVWAYGVTMWEIFSKGQNPFAKNKSGDIRSLLERGIRLECPQHCNEDLYTEMIRPCWERTPSKRPTFGSLTESLERLFHGAPDGDEYYDDNSRGEQLELYDSTLPN